MQKFTRRIFGRSRALGKPWRGSDSSRTRALTRTLLAGLVGLAFGLGLAACSTRTLPPDFSQPTESHTISSVPAFKQRTMQCGPAALASVLNHYGNSISPDEIAAEIYRPESMGTLNLDLALYPRQRGYSTKWYSGSLRKLLNAVDRGLPLIVMVDRGLPPLQALHFMVVAGYTPEGLVVMAGEDKPELTRWKTFATQWERTNRWTLEIHPDTQGTP